MNNKNLNIRVIAIGDVHGEYETFKLILFDANLIDLSGNWKGENTILVQTGDMIDRGPNPIESVEYIRSIQEQAIKSDRKVIRLLGNHELMLLQGDYSFANFQKPEELAKILKEEVAERKVQAAWTDGEHLFSHAGVRTQLRQWLEGSTTKSFNEQFSSERLSRIADAANDVLMKAAVSSDCEGPLFYIDSTRGGQDPFGGIFWGGGENLVGSANAFEMLQVFGHTPTRKPAFQIERGLNLINIDCGMWTGYGGNCGYLEITPKGELIEHTKARDSMQFKSRPINL